MIQSAATKPTKTAFAKRQFSKRTGSEPRWDVAKSNSNAAYADGEANAAEEKPYSVRAIVLEDRIRKAKEGIRT
jgi:hypothetical protein